MIEQGQVHAPHCRRYLSPADQYPKGFLWRRLTLSGRDGRLEREYHYVRTEREGWLWVYFDRRRRRWFLQGSVE